MQAQITAGVQLHGNVLILCGVLITSLTRSYVTEFPSRGKCFLILNQAPGTTPRRWIWISAIVLVQGYIVWINAIFLEVLLLFRPHLTDVPIYGNG